MTAASTEDRKQRAASRIIDALERGSTPTQSDLKAAGVCRSCYGFGYYYESDEDAAHDERTTCGSCDGDGIPKRK